MSDCDAVSLVHETHNYAKTPEDAVADVLRAGIFTSIPNLSFFKLLLH